MPQIFRVEKKTRYPAGRERQRCSFSYVLFRICSNAAKHDRDPFSGKEHHWKFHISYFPVRKQVIINEADQVCAYTHLHSHESAASDKDSQQKE